jgi:hypothetical protein
VQRPELLSAYNARSNALRRFRLALVSAPEVFGFPSALFGAALLEGYRLDELLSAKAARGNINSADVDLVHLNFTRHDLFQNFLTHDSSRFLSH